MLPSSALLPLQFFRESRDRRRAAAQRERRNDQKDGVRHCRRHLQHRQEGRDYVGDMPSHRAGVQEEELLRRPQLCPLLPPSAHHRGRRRRAGGDGERQKETEEVRFQT